MNITETVMRTCSFSLKVPSTTAPEFIDITEEVAKYLSESEISNGIVVVFSRHTTCSVVIQENEPLLLEDFKAMLNRLSPSQGIYKHNDFSVRTVHMHENECANGHSHCQSLILGTSETIPVLQGKMSLGEWQRIFLLELDGEKAPQLAYREVLVQIMGQP